VIVGALLGCSGWLLSGYSLAQVKRAYPQVFEILVSGYGSDPSFSVSQRDFSPLLSSSIWKPQPAYNNTPLLIISCISATQIAQVLFKSLSVPHKIHRFLPL